MQHQARTPLEPISAIAIAVALAHLLAGIVAWRLLTSAVPPLGAPAGESLQWMSPADFVAASAATASKVATEPARAASSTLVAATPRESPPTQPALKNASALRTEANKFITLSPLLPEDERAPAQAKPYMPVLSLLDIAVQSENEKVAEAVRTAGSPAMDVVDDAVVDAYLRAWVAPPIASVPPNQRRAALQVSIARDGAVAEARIATPSGSAALDQSILEAANRVAKIPATLPSRFSKERYDLQINFLIE